MIHYRLFILLLFQAIISSAEDAVYFPSYNLKTSVEKSLTVSNPTPTDMLKLSSLDVLGDIFDLSGIEYATNLKELYVSLRTDNIEPLKKLHNLNKLELSNIKFDILNALSDLDNLTDLTVNGTELQDIRSIAKLTRLKRLVLNRNPIHDISSLSQLKYLEILELSHNKITNIYPLSELPNLKRLVICENAIDDISAISKLTNLDTLKIENAQVRDISALANLKNLTRLDLSSNKISDITPIRDLNKLHLLDLTENQITDITIISGLSSLAKLGLSRNQIVDISALVKLNNLENISIYENPLNKDAFEIYIPRIVTSNPHIAIGCYLETKHNIQDYIFPVLSMAYFIFFIVFASWLRKKKKRKYLLIFILIYILTLCPLPIREKDFEKAVNHSVNSLLNDKRVISNKSYIPFYESKSINKYKNIYYNNDINIDEAIYKNLGLEPLPDEYEDGFPYDFYVKNIYIEFTHYDYSKNESTSSIHFNYYYGTLAAHGYKIIIYRNIFGTFMIYSHQWVS